VRRLADFGNQIVSERGLSPASASSIPRGSVVLSVLYRKPVSLRRPSPISPLPTCKGKQQESHVLLLNHCPNILPAVSALHERNFPPCALLLPALL
jgi:hypothetical protein